MSNSGSLSCPYLIWCHLPSCLDFLPVFLLTVLYHTGPCAVLRTCQTFPAFQCQCLLFPLPGMHLFQIAKWFGPSLPSGFCSNDSSSKRPSLTTLSKIVPLPLCLFALIHFSPGHLSQLSIIV